MLIDLNKIWEKTKELIWSIVKIPFQVWHDLPIYVHWIAGGILIFIAILILILVIKYRDKWKYTGY